MEEAGAGGGFSGGAKAVASLGVVGGLVLLVGGGLVMKDHINGEMGRSLFHVLLGLGRLFLWNIN